MPASDQTAAASRLERGTNGYDLTAAMAAGSVHVRARSTKNGKSHCLVELTAQSAIAMGRHLIAMGEAATEKEAEACG